VFTLLQTTGQRAFLVLEKIFNAIFGERLNPLYYLGAITYFLLWIVIATGLYLYAFFETGVAAAYGSVEALTHGQWYAGGVLRSVHRYASDGLVITMLLHLVRHFTFDHHRGFRWFSWVSGVVLLWLTFASGVNGYMLPWDRLAQFVVTATTEWFAGLPIIGVPLPPNFITNANVSYRLFSPLSFLASAGITPFATWLSQTDMARNRNGARSATRRDTVQSRASTATKPWSTARSIRPCC